VVLELQSDGAELRLGSRGRARAVEGAVPGGDFDAFGSVFAAQELVGTRDAATPVDSLYQEVTIGSSSTGRVATLPEQEGVRGFGEADFQTRRADGFTRDDDAGEVEVAER